MNSFSEPQLDYCGVFLSRLVARVMNLKTG